MFSIQLSKVTESQHASSTRVTSSLGGRVIQRLANPERSSQGAAAMVATASMHPPAFARIAASSRPRTRSDQEVVIPQDGQRISNLLTKKHSSSPSWR
ncbi:MAG: hypothetical protein VB817_01580 [Pirellulaceae bacterium]